MLARQKEGELEVLLLKRNKALKFAGGVWVFPGGKVEQEEIETTNSDIEAAKLAAARETKEEANVDINPNELLFFSHWTTPIIEPRRYATWFFFGDISGKSLNVKIDDSEIKDHLWISPQAALDRFADGKLVMMPPTFVSLQRIRKCSTIQEAREELTKTNPFFILPNLQIHNQNMYCLYEGDAGFESGDIHATGPRHRLFGNMIKGDFVFEYKDCEEVLPINGGMHL